MTRSPSAYRLDLDLDGPGRLAGRLSSAVVRAIAAGQLADGDLAPSSRAVAANLSIARSVVVEAYGELTAAGYFVTRAGGGTRVAPGASHAARAGAFASTRPSPEVGARAGSPTVGGKNRTARTPPLRYDLRAGLPDPSLIDARDWAAAWRAASRASLPASRSSIDPTEAVASYLRQARGLGVQAADVLLFPTVASALTVIAAAATKPGHTLAFEDPGYDIGRVAVTAGGARPRPVPVDDEGLRVGALRPSDWGVYVTPAHQFPTGSRLSITRRTALLEWATAAGRLVLEDDYDGEFRYDVAPMPPLKSMSGNGRHDRVIYLGTSSKIITPQLRVAWAVVPSWLRDRVAAAQRAQGAHVSDISAAALAEFVNSRAVTRQLNRAQRVYGARRAAFTAACRTRLPGVELRGVDAGLHVLLTLPEGVDDVAVATELEHRGLACAPLSRYSQSRSCPTPSGLVCGYANLSETRALRAVVLIRDTLDQVFDPGPARVQSAPASLMRLKA